MAGITINSLLSRDAPEEESGDMIGPCELEDGQILDVDFVRNVEREFAAGADELLKSMNLSHLRVRQ